MSGLWGQAEIITTYYTCSGRRRHGKTICGASSTLRAERIARIPMQIDVGRLHHFAPGEYTGGLPSTTTTLA